MIHSSQLAPSCEWVEQKSNTSYTVSANLVQNSAPEMQGWAMLCHGWALHTGGCLVLEPTQLCNCTNLFDILLIMLLLRTLTQIKKFWRVAFWAHVKIRSPLRFHLWAINYIIVIIIYVMPFCAKYLWLFVLKELTGWIPKQGCCKAGGERKSLQLLRGGQHIM